MHVSCSPRLLSLITLAEIPFALGQQLRGRLCIEEELVHLLHIHSRDLLSAGGLSDDLRRRQQLHGITQGGARANLTLKKKQRSIYPLLFSQYSHIHTYTYIYIQKYSTINIVFRTMNASASSSTSMVSVSARMDTI